MHSHLFSYSNCTAIPIQISFSKTVSHTIFEVITAEDQKVSRNQDPLALDVVDTVQRRFPF